MCLLQPIPRTARFIHLAAAVLLLMAGTAASAQPLRIGDAAAQPQTRVDFDTLDASRGSVTGEPLNAYLAKYGIALSSLTPGTRIEVVDSRTIYGGKAAKATSLPNMIAQVGSNKPITWKMSFRAPLDKVAFARVGLVADPENGIVHPEWRAFALDANGKELDRTGESEIASYLDVPAKTFALRGPGIAAIRWDSNARDFAAFSGVLIDDLVLHAPQGNEQVPLLLRDLQNPDESIRLRAAKELGKLGAAARDAVPLLQQLTQDPDEDVRLVAAAALTRIRAAVVPTGTRPDLFVLSVGIDRYQAPISNLAGCVNDAEGMANVFRQQAGTTFGKVNAQILADANGTRARIDAELAALRRQGKAGDWYVILMSGHGEPKLNRWGFLTWEGGGVTDAALLGMADELASEGKTVALIIDACFAGRVRYAAQPILNKYTDPRQGGIILMLSSMPTQLSAALQQYSAFARAVEDGLSGMADYDGDRTITLKELRRFTYNRVYELCRQRRMLPGLTVQPQDSVIDASLSVSEMTPLAQGRRAALPTPTDEPFTAMPQLTGVWVAETYRLKLDSTGTFRSAIGQASRPLQLGDGVFKANAKTIVLYHWQGADRLDITALTSDELRFRFQGRDVTLRKEKVVTPASGSVAGTLWNGTESLPGYGKLTFQFDQDGEVVMIDAMKTVKGHWSQTANKVTIAFQNCIYEATIQGKSMSGNARFTTDDRTWTFALTLAGAAAPPADAAMARVACTGAICSTE